MPGKTSPARSQADVTFSGRRFFLCALDHLTFIQAQYLLAIAVRIGLDSIWPQDGESDDQYAYRIRMESIPLEMIPAVLSGYLVTEGEEWSAKSAETAARWIEQLVAEEDHTTMMTLASQLAPDFFCRSLYLLGMSRLRPGSFKVN